MTVTLGKLRVCKCCAKKLKKYLGSSVYVAKYSKSGRPKGFRLVSPEDFEILKKTKAES